LSAGGRRRSTTNLTAQETSRIEVKGKLGYSFGSTLVYATGGIARSQTRYESPAVVATALTPATIAGRRNNSAFAPVLGVGIEQKLTDQISLKAEVEASPSRRTSVTLPAGRTNVENRQVGAKIGLNYHF
jgi:opacity protein-like surface antigen